MYTLNFYLLNNSFNYSKSTCLRTLLKEKKCNTATTDRFHFNNERMRLISQQLGHRYNVDQRTF